MAEPIVAHITLRSANSIKQNDELESLAAALTAALKLKQSQAGKALKLAVQLGEAQPKATAPTEDALKCSKLPFTQALKDSFSQARSVSAETEVQVASKSAHDRLAAALNALGHSGYTLISTPPNVRPTVRDYHYAYMKGMLTPTDVAGRLVAFLDKHNRQYNWLSVYSADHIRHQAAASAARYAAGKSLSVFDGVPYVVTDSLDALPYETSCGTAFMGKLRPAKADAPCVATLRSMGAILLGKAAMPELGIPASSHSTINPHDPSKAAGSGSVGCASAVASGLCPVAIGTDTGCSIGVSSSFCGVVGFRASSGRLADDSAAHGSQSSLVATTPIANSVGDALLLYAAMANTAYPGAEAPRTLSLPQQLLHKQERSAINGDYILGTEQPLQGKKIGLCRNWVEESSTAVQEMLQQTLVRLEQLGANIVDVSLPDLEQIQASHLVTFSKEAAADGAKQGWLNNKDMRSQLNLDTRMFICNSLKVTDADYTQAQRVRAKILACFEGALEECDVIMTPATPDVAPALPQQDATGTYDIAAASSTARFTLGASLTGLPALVMPAGRRWGVFEPAGVQFIGKPWAESTLLRTAAALEQQMLEDGYPAQIARTALNPIECAVGVHPVALRVTKSYQNWKKNRIQAKA